MLPLILLNGGIFSLETLCPLSQVGGEDKLQSLGGYSSQGSNAHLLLEVPRRHEHLAVRQCYAGFFRESSQVESLFPADLNHLGVMGRSW